MDLWLVVQDKEQSLLIFQSRNSLQTCNIAVSHSVYSNKLDSLPDLPSFPAASMARDTDRLETMEARLDGKSSRRHI